MGNPGLYHVLFLPEDWRPGGSYPLIVEYPGNAGYLTPRIPGYNPAVGTPDDNKLGYGISAGRGFLWVSLPFVEPGETGIARNWWGDTQATVDYCRRAVLSVCADYGGDPTRMLLCGFSRGSIACNYIGLRDDSIAGLWRAFFCHSHYDGVRRWPYSDSDRVSALGRLRRLKGRPQFISHEDAGGTVAETRRYIESTSVEGDFTFAPLPYPQHTALWVLRPLPLRAQLREWVRRVLA